MNMAWSAPTQTMTVAAIHVPTPSMEMPSEIRSVTKSANEGGETAEGADRSPSPARVTLRAGAGERLSGADLGWPHRQLQP